MELERVRRYGSRCGLIMLDVDHFKQVNDIHGHQTGDRVLEHLGALLRREARAPDQPARWNRALAAVGLLGSSWDSNHK